MALKLSKKHLLRNILLLSVGLSLSTSALGQAIPRTKSNSLNQKLLDKVLKKPTEKTTLELELLKSIYASWGVDPDNKQSSINLSKAWRGFKKQKDIVVAVIDTGIDPDHPYLKDNLYVPNKPILSPSNYGLDFSKGKDNRYKPFDTHGHGTHVAGIVKSVYPGVKILALKYYNRNASGQANLASTVAALEYAVDQNVDIINYSGGGPEPSDDEARVLKKAEEKGILVVAAAGNEESDIDKDKNAYYPASYKLDNIITVTAHDKSLRPLSSSNYGKKTVDISAPGYRIRSALPNRRSGYLTGTSQATAFVSGVAAMLKAQFPKLTAKNLKRIINQSAKQELTLMTKSRSGGRLDAAKAVQLAHLMFPNKGPTKIANAQVKRKTASKKEAIKMGKIFYRLNN